MSTQINPQTDALVIIDIQNDFIPGGALAVSGGDEIIPGVARFAKMFDTIVLSQDWHPAGHSSFATSHDGAAPFSKTQMPYGDQTLWPDHCVQGTPGAEFHADLVASGIVNRVNMIIRKGMNPDVDSYSAFFENDKITSTGLAGYLRDKGIERVFFVGLAYDFCVAYSAIDARAQGFDSVIVKDLTRAIAMPLENEPGTTVNKMEALFREESVQLCVEADMTPQPRARQGASISL